MNPVTRTPLATLILACLAALASQSVAHAQPPSPIPLGDITIELELVADGVTSPLVATGAGDGSGRLFVVDQIGQIRIIDAGGNLLPTPFLDVSSDMVTLDTFFDERGLLGLAFHPDYEENGRLFVRYSRPRAGSSGEPCFGTSRGCHEEVLAEFSVSGDPDIANPTGQILFAVDEPEFNHNAGAVHFGPAQPGPPQSAMSPSSPSSATSLLYFSLGDGGGANDGLHQTPPAHGPIGNGQNIETVLGAVLRIDVDSPPDPGLAYAIPPDNPFVGMTGADEIWAYGFRNPYRFSFDDGKRGDGSLYLADVGQNLFEEIDIVEWGGNYGWVIREGAHCFNPFNPGTPPASCATAGASGEPLLDPVAEYHHQDGIAVVGGFVYRGKAFPELRGKYVFGDFSTQFTVPGGRLFYIDTEGNLAQIFELRLGTGNQPFDLFLFGFGRDEDGELYVLTLGNLAPTGTAGQIWRIVPPES